MLCRIVTTLDPKVKGAGSLMMYQHLESSALDFPQRTLVCQGILHLRDPSRDAALRGKPRGGILELCSVGHEMSFVPV